MSSGAYPRRCAKAVTYWRATRNRRSRTPGAEHVLPLYPEPHGLIPRGATTDGAWTFFWDPSSGGVSFSNRGFRRVHLPEVSFSDFLLRYAAGDGTMFV